MRADYRRCERCGAWCTDPPRPRTLDVPGTTLPAGYRVAYHLCRDCARTTRAVRSDLWGWIYPAPAPAPEAP